MVDLAILLSGVDFIVEWNPTPPHVSTEVANWPVSAGLQVQTLSLKSANHLHSRQLLINKVVSNHWTGRSITHSLCLHNLRRYCSLRTFSIALHIPEWQKA